MSEQEKQEEKPCTHEREYTIEKSQIGMWEVLYCPDCERTRHWCPY